MSKLSKFKYNITVTEAAALLARLINEDVSEDDIEQLLAAHWIDGYYMCDCAIIKVEFFLSNEENEKQKELGIYLVEPSDEVGVCFGLPYPCGEVFLTGIKRAYALTDKYGSMYVLRDRETDQYLGSDADSVFFTNLVIEADSVYRLAEIANIDEPAPESCVEVRDNKWCDGEVKYYPFFPGGWQKTPAQQMISTQANLETPSSALTIASLLEIALNKDRKNLNQSSLITEILEKNPGIRGLSESGLQKIFSNANRILAEAKPVPKTG